MLYNLFSVSQLRLSTVDLLALTGLDQLLLLLQTQLTFYKTSYLNEEVNRAVPSPSASASWSNTQAYMSWGSIFSRVRPFFEQAVSNLDPLRSMQYA